MCAPWIQVQLDHRAGRKALLPFKLNGDGLPISESPIDEGRATQLLDKLHLHVAKRDRTFKSQVFRTHSKRELGTFGRH